MESNTITPLKLTPAAIVKAIDLVKKEEIESKSEDLFLRIRVLAGGCSGLRYNLFFDDSPIDGDVKQIFNVDGNSSILVCVDSMSAPYLSGAEIDFVDTIEKQGFIIENPNATNTCACGDSFA